MRLLAVAVALSLEAVEAALTGDLASAIKEKEAELAAIEGQVAAWQMNEASSNSSSEDDVMTAETAVAIAAGTIMLAILTSVAAVLAWKARLRPPLTETWSSKQRCAARCGNRKGHSRRAATTAAGAPFPSFPAAAPSSFKTVHTKSPLRNPSDENLPEPLATPRHRCCCPCGCCPFFIGIAAAAVIIEAQCWRAGSLIVIDRLISEK